MKFLPFNNCSFNLTVGWADGCQCGLNGCWWCTQLCLVALVGRCGVVHVLVQQGTGVQQINPELLSPLHVTALTECTGQECTASYLEAQHGKMATAKMLLEEGSNALHTTGHLPAEGVVVMLRCQKKPWQRYLDLQSRHMYIAHFLLCH